MNTDSIGRAVALVAAVISAVGGLAILLEDVVKGAAPFEIKHGITIGIVALAILAGHSVVAAWRARHVFGVLGFTVVFLAATGLVVFKSTGRQAEHTFQSQAEADAAAEKRAAIKAAIARSEAMLAEAQANLVRECKTGRGPRCKGVEATIGVYEAAITGHHAEIDRLGPPKPVAPEAENFANLAAVFGADKAKVKAAALLLVPFLTTALFEFGAIVGFAFAFRHRPATREVSSQATEQPRQPLPAETAQTSFHADDLAATRATILGTVASETESPREALPFSRRRPGNPGNRGNGPRGPKPDLSGNPRPFGGQPFSKLEAERDLVTLLATGATVDEQNDLAQRWGVHKGTASKWLRDMRERGLIPPPQRVGRCHRLVAAV